MKPTARFGVRSTLVKRELLSAQLGLAAGGGLSLSR